MKKLMDYIARGKVRAAIALILAIIVAFSTAYSLVLPSVSLSYDTAETMAGIDLGKSSRQPDDTSPLRGDPVTGERTDTAEDRDTSKESPPDTGTAENSDAPVSFDAEVREETDHGETYTMQVHVEASQDAFPENTSMSVEPTRDQDVLDSIGSSVEGNVTAVHSVDISFADETGAPVNPAESSRVSVTLAPAAGEESVSQSGKEETETAVVLYTEDQGAEQMESSKAPAFQVEPEMEMDTDTAVSFDMSGTGGREETQTFALVEVIPEEETAENEEEAIAAQDELESDAEDLQVPASAGGAAAKPAVERAGV